MADETEQELGFSETTKEELGTYVYDLADPQTQVVFYVGKGTGDRVHAHANAAIAEEHGLKLDQIREIIKKTNRLPLHRIVAYGLTPDEAFLLEAVLIKTHRIQGVPLKNKQSGHYAKHLYVSDEDLEIRFAPRVVREEDITEPTLLVSLKGKGDALPDYWAIKDDPEELARRTLGIWRVKERNADQVCLVAGVFRKVVRVVYRVVPDPDGHRWHVERTGKGHRRKRFHAARLADHMLVRATIRDENGLVKTKFPPQQSAVCVGPFSP